MRYCHMRQAILVLLLSLMIGLCSGHVWADDTTPPEMFFLTYDSCQFNTDSLHARWGATDAESGIAGYEYAVGTSMGGADVQPWTWTTSTDVTLAGLSLNHIDVYYWTVRAQNGAGLWSGYWNSEGTRVPLELATIAEAKSYQDGTWLRLPGKLTSANFPGYQYIQEPDRSAGIRIDQSFSRQYVELVGQITSSFGERQIHIYTGDWYGTPPEVKPLAMKNKELAGKARRFEGQVLGGRGANNVGLLVRTCGRVIAHAGDCFYIDDGSGLNDALKPGLTVSLAGMSIAAPPVGTYVAVTGISAVDLFGGSPIRVLKPRQQSDIAPTRVRVAYIYDYDPGAGLSWKNFLDSESWPTDIMSVSEAGTADFSNYNLIIAGYDSGSVASWGTAAIVEHIVNSQKPILGIETGGLSLFQQIGGLNYIASTAAFDQGMLMDVTDRTSTVYATPYAVLPPLGTSIKVTDNPLCWYGFETFTPAPASVTPLGNVPGGVTKSVFGWESRYMYWGFRDKPDILTTEGKHLFVNAAWYAVLHGTPSSP